MLILSDAIACGIAIAALAGLACWYRRRWSAVWCGVAFLAGGWAYTALVRAEMPPGYHPLLEHVVGWAVMGLGALLALVNLFAVWVDPPLPRRSQ